MIGICDICRYGQTDKCTNPNRDNLSECFVSHTGTTIAEKRIRADAIEEAIQKQRVIIDEDGVMYKVVFLKDLEQMQKGTEE